MISQKTLDLANEIQKVAHGGDDAEDCITLAVQLSDSVLADKAAHDELHASLRENGLRAKK